MKVPLQFVSVLTIMKALKFKGQEFMADQTALINVVSVCIQIDFVHLVQLGVDF